MIKTILAAAVWGSVILFFVFMAWPLAFPGAPFLPSFSKRKKTTAEGLERVINLVQTHFPKGRMVDLGSGDGRVVMEFAQNGFEATGIEINPFLVLWSRIKIGNAKIIKGNFWRVNLSSFDIVYIFQLNSVNILLADKFKKELKPGALIISVGFILPGFELIAKDSPFLVYKN